ncbi:GPC1 [Scenedesmus sp. PABB004]|nr:GPC1 [Scenedesmus sp. PABB004]
MARTAPPAGRQTQPHAKQQQQLEQHEQQQGQGRPRPGSGGAARQRRRSAPAAASCPVARRVCAELGAARRREARAQLAGASAFGGLLFVAGAVPAALPFVFLVFFAVAMPLRAAAFWRSSARFYLLDFCYFVNAAVAAVLLLAPDDPRAEAAASALADGPLAGALAAWQCPWIWGSAEHTVSVLMHHLPGLALYAHRHHTPRALRGWRGLARAAAGLARGQLPPLGAAPAPPSRPEHLALWLGAAPLVFYAVWQLLYFLAVQERGGGAAAGRAVVWRSFILSHGYETSYTCLAARAAKTNNFWNRLVRRGSIARRCAVYGALQLAFTVLCLVLFVPTYLDWRLALLLQAAKFVVPLYYGCRFAAVKAPQHAFLDGLAAFKAIEAAEQAEQAAAAAGAQHPPQHQAQPRRGGAARRACAAEAVPCSSCGAAAPRAVAA